MTVVTINGRWDLDLPEHRAVRPHWTRPEGWERERLDSMAKNLMPGDVVIDVGAEEGDLSALYASWVGPTGAVILVEPNPLVWPNIAYCFQANELAPPLACFVGFAASETVLHDTELPGQASSQAIIFDGWPPCADGPLIPDHGFRNLSERSPDTPAVRLSDLADWAAVRVDAITIDVEGSELRVLQGAEALLRDQHPLIWVSEHPTFMLEMYGHGPGELHEFMSGLGYGRQHLATDHEIHALYSHPLGRKPR